MNQKRFEEYVKNCPLTAKDNGALWAMRRLRSARAAWKAIEKWVNVETLPETHPLKQMRKALK